MSYILFLNFTKGGIFSLTISNSLLEHFFCQKPSIAFARKQLNNRIRPKLCQYPNLFNYLYDTTAAVKTAHVSCAVAVVEGKKRVSIGWATCLEKKREQPSVKTLD
ncbi:hypothetical protein ACJX0J_017134 [Zea mays]